MAPNSLLRRRSLNARLLLVFREKERNEDNSHAKELAHVAGKDEL